MGRRIVGAIFVVVLLVGAFYWWKHHQETVQMGGGDFTCNGCMTPEEKARFERENAGETADGQSEHKVRTARADDAAGYPNGAASAPTYPAAQNQTSATAPVYPSPTYQAQPVQPAYAAAPNGLPVADTVAPNPPNGMLFGGKGNFQWYRQGNLTWRVDTVSGRSCIVYATMEEWQKQIVYSHGCGRNA